MLCWLNDGDRQGNKYTEDPHTLVKDLFRQQEELVHKWNQRLYNEWLQLKTERKMFNDNTSPCLQEAIKHLCLLSYLRFKCRVQCLHEYNVGEITPKHRVVESTRYPNASPHHCLKEDGAAYFVCNKCEASIAYEEQCEHSLVANDHTFVKSHFHIWHMRRDKQRGSYPDHLNQTQSPDNDNMNVSAETDSEAFVANREVEKDSNWEDLDIRDENT